MNIIRTLAIIAVLTGVSTATTKAYAESKPWIWSWWESHWDGLDFIPYMEDGKRPHNSQWDKSQWHPEDWIQQRKDAAELLDGFYTADILRGQYVDNGVPVLEVGPAFYQLGGKDKRRVTETVDYVYGITKVKENGMFMLYDWRTKDAIGSYTMYGLQIQ